LLTLMRPSHSESDRCPWRNHRFFCSRFRTADLLWRLGILKSRWTVSGARAASAWRQYGCQPEAQLRPQSASPSLTPSLPPPGHSPTERVRVTAVFAKAERLNARLSASTRSCRALRMPRSTTLGALLVVTLLASAAAGAPADC